MKYAITGLGVGTWTWHDLESAREALRLAADNIEWLLPGEQLIIQAVRDE